MIRREPRTDNDRVKVTATIGLRGGNAPGRGPHPPAPTPRFLVLRSPASETLAARIAAGDGAERLAHLREPAAVAARWARNVGGAGA